MGTPLLRDIQLFVNHEDDLLKAAAITTIVSATRAAFYSSSVDFAGKEWLITDLFEDICVILLFFRLYQCEMKTEWF